MHTSNSEKMVRLENLEENHSKVHLKFGDHYTDGTRGFTNSINGGQNQSDFVNSQECVTASQ